MLNIQSQSLDTLLILKTRIFSSVGSQNCVVFHDVRVVFYDLSDTYSAYPLSDGQTGKSASSNSGTDILRPGVINNGVDHPPPGEGKSGFAAVSVRNQGRGRQFDTRARARKHVAGRRHSQLIAWSGVIPLPRRRVGERQRRRPFGRA